LAVTFFLLLAVFLVAAAFFLDAAGDLALALVEAFFFDATGDLAAAGDFLLTAFLTVVFLVEAAFFVEVVFFLDEAGDALAFFGDFFTEEAAGED
jgi:hypothetical protein